MDLQGVIMVWPGVKGEGEISCSFMGYSKSKKVGVGSNPETVLVGVVTHHV